MHGPIEDVYRRIRRNRLVEVRFLEDMDAGLSIIRSYPALRDLQVDDHHATLELETDDAGVAELLRQLSQAQVGLRQLR